MQARTDLLSNAQDATNTGGQALQYLNAAKAIMDSKGAPVAGPLGGLVAKVTAPFGSVDATNYQEAAKYLGNAAIQAGKGNFGKGMTENDVNLQKDQLSPSLHMTDGALRDLIDTGIKNTQYGMDSCQSECAHLSCNWRRSARASRNGMTSISQPAVPRSIRAFSICRPRSRVTSLLIKLARSSLELSSSPLTVGRWCGSGGRSLCRVLAGA